MQITWKGCAPSNYRSGRPNGQTPKLVVIHLMDGSLAGTDTWFATTRSNPSSAHYGIGKAGTIHQYVKEEDTAYHAGRVMGATVPLPAANPNWASIGIEHEGRIADEWPEAMVQASAELVADICKRHGIPIDRSHIVGHREIYSQKACPGPKCPLDEIVRRAAALIPT